MRRAAAVFGALLLCAACSAPPQEEIDRAQGAIDAARAAGAEQYAPESFAAATAAMEETHDAVRQNDYRLALSRATDAHERALESAGQAASSKALARSAAERAIAVLAASVAQLQERITAAETARMPARELEPARRTLADAERVLQEARAALEAEDYLKASAVLEGRNEAIAPQIRALNDAVDGRGGRGARRRR